MDEITVTRAELKLDLIAAGLNVTESVPERVTPPIVIINAGSPYLTVASVGSEYLLNLELILVAATATNKQATQKLDELIADTLNAIPGYAVMRGVEKPYSLQTGAAEYLATTISLEIQITI